MGTLLQLPLPLDSSICCARLRDALTRTRPGRIFLLRAVVRSIIGDIGKVFFLSLVLLASGLGSPFILRQLLRSLEGKVAVPPGWVADLAQFAHLPLAMAYPFICSLGLFLVAVLSLLSVHHLFFIQVSMGLKVFAAIRALLYEKAMRLARFERRNAPSGKVITLVSTDAQKVITWVTFMHEGWYHPAQITIALILLYHLVGSAAIYGTISMLLPLFAAAALIRYQNRLRRRILAITDERVGFTAEVISHIKTVKFQAWEQPLSQKILGLREEEVRWLRRVNAISSISGLASTLAPTLGMLVTFSLFLSKGGTLDPALVFPAMSLILVMRYALNNAPNTIFNLMEALVSASRIDSFLNLQEHAPRLPQPASPHAVQISGAAFEWAPGDPALRVDALTVRRGELVAVVGTVGGGKSALLLGILNEITAREGSVTVGGSLGYVSQQAWIVSDSIRNNITMHNSFCPERYARALAASGLHPDLRQLPDGDATQIGERGVNLSGGQRQRVALARALYAGADIFLLDDPLSALDPLVANAVFDSLIRRELKDATRILVTHRLEYALQADRVLVIEDGRIQEDGHPAKLKASGGRFANLLRFHSDTSSLSSAEPHEESPRQESAERPTSDAASSEHVATRLTVEAEERDVGAVDRAVLVQYLRKFMPGLLAPLLAAVILARHVLGVSTDLWLAVFPVAPLDPYAPFVAGYCALVTFLAVFHLARWLLFLSCGLRAGIQSHKDLLAGVLAAPLRFFESNPVGRIVNRFSRDLETIEASLPRALQDSSHTLLDIVVVCSMLLLLAPWTILILIPLFIVYYRLQADFRPTSREAQRLDSIARSPLFALLSESLNGVETVRASGLSEPFQQRFEGYIDGNSGTGYSLTASNRWLGIRLEILAALVLLVAGISATFLIGSSFPIAVSGLLLTYSINFSSAMNWFVRSIVQTESNLTSFERIQFYSNTPAERRDGAPAPVAWPTHGEVRFCGLTVRYRPELPAALNSLSFTVPGGSRVGIVGRSGSGKSTLILALARLLEPSAGHIEIDGVDTATLTLESLRSSMTAVPQEPVLFSGPLRDSLDPFRTASDEDVFQALKRVELERLVRSLPLGLATPVHEGGLNFSGGQRQLFCLARALLRNSKLIVLDEATANIDVETDFAIQRTIRREFTGATLLVVAHRLGTVIDSDLIVVLEQGRFGEIGTPEELLAKADSLLSGFVREMHRSQAA